jgi:subtilisin family serine protease
VAKHVQLVDVKVFGTERSTPFSIIRAGIEYVIAEKEANPTIPMVINLSLGSEGVQFEYEEAINEAVAANVVVVVAAGNSAGNSCQNSPAFARSAIAVGATDELDLRANFSNYGACVDLYAPGVSILSSSILGDTRGIRLSGTSMAAPHVAGAAALYLERNPTWTPAQVWDAMKADAVVAIPRIWLPFRLFLKFRTTTRLLLQTDNI